MIPNKPIAPIPTEYKGVEFKSKLEARWALFMDLADIRWEYEPNGPSTAPDFWFGDKRYDYIEVKGGLPSANCIRHMRSIGCPLLAVSGFYNNLPPAMIHVRSTGIIGLNLRHVFDHLEKRQFDQAFTTTCQHRFDLREQP